MLRHFYGVCERLGLPRLRFHDLRHSTASLLLLRGIPTTTIIETLGHAVIHTTMQYAHVDDLLGPRDAANGRSNHQEDDE